MFLALFYWTKKKGFVAFCSLWGLLCTFPFFTGSLISPFFLLIFLHPLKNEGKKTFSSSNATQDPVALLLNSDWLISFHFFLLNTILVMQRF